MVKGAKGLLMWKDTPAFNHQVESRRIHSGPVQTIPEEQVFQFQPHELAATAKAAAKLCPEHPGEASEARARAAPCVVLPLFVRNCGPPW